ncbi:hypothetical protein HDU76_009496, partial [Blyttiomyces sp. JEL0837]
VDTAANQSTTSNPSSPTLQVQCSCVSALDVNWQWDGNHTAGGPDDTCKRIRCSDGQSCGGFDQYGVQHSVYLIADNGKDDNNGNGNVVVVVGSNGQVASMQPFSASSNYNSAGVIASIVLASFIGFCLIGLLGWCLWRRQKQREAEQHGSAGGNGGNNVIIGGASIRGFGKDKNSRNNGGGGWQQLGDDDDHVSVSTAHASVGTNTRGFNPRTSSTRISKAPSSTSSVQSTSTPAFTPRMSSRNLLLSNNTGSRIYSGRERTDSITSIHSTNNDVPPPVPKEDPPPIPVSKDYRVVNSATHGFRRVPNTMVVPDPATPLSDDPTPFKYNSTNRYVPPKRDGTMNSSRSGDSSGRRYQTRDYRAPPKVAGRQQSLAGSSAGSDAGSVKSLPKFDFE